ncbi:MAG: hypothetical protein ACI4C5_09020 [Lachnospiraceae bacterium]
MEGLLILIELAALAWGFWIAKSADKFFAGVEKDMEEENKQEEE